MSDFDIRLGLGQPNELVLYSNDVLIKRPLLFKAKSGAGTGNKNKITRLSASSLKRLAFFASNTTQQFNVMITLTYPDVYPTNGKEVKRHLNIMLTRLRKRYPSIKYLWFLEFQSRGAPHLHLLVSVSFVPYDWIREAWYEIVGSGDVKHFDAGTKVERVRKNRGAKHYAVKYAMKCEQKDVPCNYRDVGRFWGHSRGIEPRVIRTIQVMGYEDAWHYLSDWEYVDRINHDKIISVLYNATSHVKY